MERMWAIVERDLRRFRKSPMLIIMSLFMPLVQLIVLGHAFGGQVKHLKVALVDQDHGVPALKLEELGNAVRANARTFEWVDYDDQGEALQALRDGKVNGVLTIPPGFSRKTLTGDAPRVALIEDNTDGFVSATLAGAFSGMMRAYTPQSAVAAGPGLRSVPTLDVVEMYPYVPYIQYLLPGTTVMSIFMMVMIGGGIIFIDDKARGLHEGYLVTPVTRLELIMGFNLSGAMKGMLAGVMVVTLGALIAGVPHAFALTRLLKLFAVVGISSVTLVSMMFLLMVRVSDPLLPRALFGVLNTLLWFPSGAVYPQQAFPGWMRAIAVVDPFTYAVHALKSVLLKDAGFGAIGLDLLWLSLFAVATMTAATLLFKREL
jgi:ABC-2 type transport system permease protein